LDGLAPERGAHQLPVDPTDLLPLPLASLVAGDAELPGAVPRRQHGAPQDCRSVEPAVRGVVLCQQAFVRLAPDLPMTRGHRRRRLWQTVPATGMGLPGRALRPGIAPGPEGAGVSG